MVFFSFSLIHSWRSKGESWKLSNRQFCRLTGCWTQIPANTMSLLWLSNLWELMAHTVLHFIVGWFTKWWHLSVNLFIWSTQTQSSRNAVRMLINWNIKSARFSYQINHHHERRNLFFFPPKLRFIPMQYRNKERKKNRIREILLETCWFGLYTIEWQI